MCIRDSAYTDQIVQQKINSVQEPVECSSSIINAVINTKFGEAQEKGIKTICQIHIPIPEELELDISIILFNLLDNAIAYEEQGIENAQISVSITKTAGYLRILVKNKIKESVPVSYTHLQEIANGSSSCILSLRTKPSTLY